MNRWSATCRPKSVMLQWLSSRTCYIRTGPSGKILSSPCARRVACFHLEERDRRIKRVAELLEIGALLRRRPSQLSGGQRQRVSLGRALVRHAKAALLDEPISHLDARLRHDLRGELKLHQRENGVTTLYATPDFTEASAIADRIAVLIDGQLRQFAAPETVYDAPADRDVALMAGDPKINLFDVVLTLTGEPTSYSRTRLCRSPLHQRGSNTSA